MAGVGPQRVVPVKMKCDYLDAPLVAEVPRAEHTWMTERKGKTGVAKARRDAKRRRK